MTLKPNFILRNIADEFLVVPICEEADRIQGVITLSESGAFLWEKLETEQTVDTLVESLLDEYDVDEATAKNSVVAFVDSLREIGCIEE